MAQNGVKTVDLATDVQLDEVIGNKLGGTKRVPVDQFVQTLLGAGPLKTAIDGLQASIPITFETTALMVASTTLVIGDVVQVSDGRNWKIVAAGTGTADGINYINLATLQAQRITSASGSSRVLTKGVAFAATPAENGSTIVGSAAFTLSLAAAASLGNGWSVIVDAEVGAITIDPNMTELIDGAATLVVSQGETARVICDGTAFRSVFHVPTISQAAWTAGTSTVDGLISPKKLADTVGAASGGGAPDALFEGEFADTFVSAYMTVNTNTKLTLNTTRINNLAGAALSGNTITGLVAGNYLIRGFSTFNGGGSGFSQNWIYDETGAATLLNGSRGMANYGEVNNSLYGIFTLSATSTISLRGRVTAAGMANGMRLTSTLGRSYIVNSVAIWKV